MSSQQRLVVLLGSVTPPGRLRRSVDEALVRLVERSGARVELIDLADNDVPFADGRSAEDLGGDVLRISHAVSAAEAVVVATPVYRGTLTGALKNLLDHLTVASLEGKPTAIVTMGNTLHHYLGAERHLRDILAFFGAVIAPVGAYLSASDFDADGATGTRAARARRAPRRAARARLRARDSGGTARATSSCSARATPERQPPDY